MEVLKKKVGFVSLGCDKNRVDLEKMIYNIKRAGFEITADDEEANIIIINTCSFILSAREESIDAILLTGANKGKGKLEKIVVTGCLNEMQYSDLAVSLPEVDAFVNIKDNDNIVDIIYGIYGENNSKKLDFDKLHRSITTPKHYAFLKISDGCDNFCSYCKIPYIRGRYKSEKLDDLIIEANNLVQGGAREIILVAQDVTKYGTDFKDGTTLITLIRALSQIDGLEWIRLLYCYPESITKELIDEIKNNPKVCKYLDIPLQHIDSTILKKMNRKNSYDKIVKLVNELRLNIPDIALRSTFILGLPGETKEHFDKLVNFISEYKLNQVGFFAYSREEGTRAYDFDGQVSEKTKNDRVKKASATQYQVVQEYNQSMIGKVLDVVVDYFDDEYAICRSQYHNPETDSCILVLDDSMEQGKVYKIKIIGAFGYDLEGERV